MCDTSIDTRKEKDALYIQQLYNYIAIHYRYYHHFDPYYTVKFSLLISTLPSSALPPFCSDFRALAFAAFCSTALSPCHPLVPFCSFFPIMISNHMPTYPGR
ncbi:hypothetical protein VC83_07416 [Pseudogymnoascus destructans]|uniref:Uncharacterized protein n=1 Tax=Pseudogymnoascus destructans TaxID=655981 RepID=A0A177A1C0_9PEZI|nr:uncharacterized protein VC83_07416 [Pseudogymnoascus destructans]OAF56069.1 hypothetical protein VC83_07416 [Pseudogymnoascus destructans]